MVHVNHTHPRLLGKLTFIPRSARLTIPDWQLAILRVIDRVAKVVTGIRHLEATISKYRALNAELEETHAEQATTLMELTISLGSIEGQLLQNNIKVERLKQTNADNSVKLRAAQVRSVHLLERGD